MTALQSHNFEHYLQAYEGLKEMIRLEGKENIFHDDLLKNWGKKALHFFGVYDL